MSKASDFAVGSRVRRLGREYVVSRLDQPGRVGIMPVSSATPSAVAVWVMASRKGWSYVMPGQMVAVASVKPA